MSSPTPPPYVELHCHSHFSFLDGASSPAELAARAAELGMPALALTDHQGVYGAVQLREACREQGIAPVYGAEVSLAPDAPAGLPGGHLTLLVESAEGWRNLCLLLTAAGLAGAKRERPLSWEQLAEHRGGLICLSGCGERGVLAAAAARGDRAGALAAGRQLAALFGPEHFYLELQRHLQAGERRREAVLIALAGHLGRHIVATNNVHYAQPDGFRLQHVLTCIRERTSLDRAGGLLYPSAQRYLKGAAEMAETFPDQPQALARTALIAERCRFQLDLRGARIPRLDLPAGRTVEAELAARCATGLNLRYAPAERERAAAQLARELAVIRARDLCGYFLVVEDLVAFARREGILCQGRGSAAGSVAAYALGIAPVDPIAEGLLFERFLSEEGTATPDIDIDFAADRREEVIQYVYRRYGAQHAAMVANVVTFRARSALLDVGKALGLPPAVLEALRGGLYAREAAAVGEALAASPALSGRLPPATLALLGELCAAIDGCPRHLSIHVGGMVVTAEPLAGLVALEPATMAGRVVLQWDKDDVEDAGLIKIDLLGLRTLGLVAECLAALPLASEQIPQDDPEVWEMLGTGDSIGVFQVESRAQVSLLPRLRPRSMQDLIVEVALIRPGPVQGGMAKAFLARRAGLEPVEVWHPLLKDLLAETQGVLVFQEQVLKVAMLLAGFSGGRADDLRRAMSRKRSREAMARLAEDFVTGCAAQGVAEAAARAIFTRLAGFAGYGFCKSHAAAFARLTWVTAWLKRHHPAVFYAALLNQQPMGFYSTGVVVEDAKRHGVRFPPLDVNRSAARWTVEGGAAGEAGSLRVPLTRLKGLGADMAARIVAAREADGPFSSLWDLLRRSRLPRPLAVALVRAGACDGLPAVAGGEDQGALRPPAAAAQGVLPSPGTTAQEVLAVPAAADDIPPSSAPARATLLWALGEMAWEEGGLDLPPVSTAAVLPAAGEAAGAAAERVLLGLSSGAHPLARLRPLLAQDGVLTGADLAARPQGTAVRVAGRVEVVQRPGTAKGICFVSLEDETGLTNLILHPQTYSACRAVLRHAAVVLAEGLLQQDHGAVHVLVRRLVAWEGGP